MRRTIAFTLAFLAAPGVFANCPATAAKVQGLLPREGASGVPINGVAAFGTFPLFAPYDPAVVISSGGTPVTGGIVTGPGGSWIYRPDSLLSPGTTYSLSIMDLSTAGTGIPSTSSFTTGTAEDLVDPVLTGAPTLTLGDYVDAVEEGGGCTRPGYWSLHVAWDPALDTSPLLYALDVDLVDKQPEFAPGVPQKGVITTANQIDLRVPQNSDATVFVYAIDAAGRQGHSQPATITLPVPPQHSKHGCSCAIDESSARAPLGLALAGLALLAFRRRARPG